MPTVQEIAAQQFATSADPMFGALKKQLVDIVAPASRAAAEQMRPMFEDVLKKTVLPEVLTWGGLFLVVAVSAGALIGSWVGRRQYQKNPRRRRHAYAA